MVDVFFIGFLTYAISYSMLLLISWYNTGKRAFLPVKDIKK